MSILRLKYKEVDKWRRERDKTFMIHQKFNLFRREMFSSTENGFIS